MTSKPQPNASESTNSGLNSDSLEELWYLRIDEKVIGPTARDDLERFLRPPRLCKQMDVICTSKSRNWHRIMPEQTLSDVLALFGIADRATTGNKIEHRESKLAFAAEWLGRQWDDLVLLAAQYRNMALVVLLIVAANAVMWVFLRDPLDREREILIEYQSIWKSIGRFRDGQQLNDDWQEFSRNSLRKLEPIVTELRKTANMQKPARQNLLYASQDHLIKLLNSPHPPTSDHPSAKPFEKYLQLVQTQLSTPTTADSKITDMRR